MYLGVNKITKLNMDENDKQTVLELLKMKLSEGALTNMKLNTDTQKCESGPWVFPYQKLARSSILYSSQAEQQEAHLDEGQGQSFWRFHLTQDQTQSRTNGQRRNVPSVITAEFNGQGETTDQTGKTEKRA